MRFCLQRRSRCVDMDERGGDRIHARVTQSPKNYQGTRAARTHDAHPCTGKALSAGRAFWLHKKRSACAVTERHADTEARGRQEKGAAKAIARKDRKASCNRPIYQPHAQQRLHDTCTCGGGEAEDDKEQRASRCPHCSPVGTTSALA